MSRKKSPGEINPGDLREKTIIGCKNPRFLQNRGYGSWHLDTTYLHILRLNSPVSFPAYSARRIHRPVSYTHLDVYKRQCIDSDLGL